MNQHLPPETVKEIGTIPAGTIAVRPAEKFIMLVGNREPWIFGDMMSRADVVEEVGEHYTILAKVIAFSVEAGTCRDATDEITSIVIERWAQDDRALTDKAREFVAMCKGEAFANAFRVELV
jgi:hypothetical protein